ncbi:MAG: hypothetical protein PHQ43_14870 [Dehalococcoidales bacterium]|nr:hypothetical protein [Dehalococcoidales bacterium]
MTRQEILKQIAETMGFMPQWTEVVPDTELEAVWQLQRQFYNPSEARHDGGLGPRPDQDVLLR